MSIFQLDLHVLHDLTMNFIKIFIETLFVNLSSINISILYYFGPFIIVVTKEPKNGTFLSLSICLHLDYPLINFNCLNTQSQSEGIDSGKPEHNIQYCTFIQILAFMN